MADELELDIELDDRFDEEPPPFKSENISTSSNRNSIETAKISPLEFEESHNPGVIEVTDVEEIQNQDLETTDAPEEHVDVGEQLASQFGFEENSQIAASYNPLVGSYQQQHIGQGDNNNNVIQSSIQQNDSQSSNVLNINALQPSDTNTTLNSQVQMNDSNINKMELLQVESSNLDFNANKLDSNVSSDIKANNSNNNKVPPVSVRPRTPGCESIKSSSTSNNNNNNTCMKSEKIIVNSSSINTSSKPAGNPPHPLPSSSASAFPTIANNNTQKTNIQQFRKIHQQQMPAGTSSSSSLSSSSYSNYRKVGDDDFDRLCTIGKGGYGKVFQVRKRRGIDAGEIYAMKVISKHKLLRSRTDTQHTRSERKILEAINHPFIVHLKYAFQNGSKLYLVMEYLSGGELFRLLDIEGYLREEWAIFYLAEIVLALGHLHKYGVIYRDLKPENIMLDSKGHIKLTDFGLCKERIFDNAITHTFCGTVDYMAPEIISRDGHSRAADWWSLGALTYDMLTGRPPFTVEGDRRATEKNIIDGNIRLPSRLSRESRAFIKQLLVRNTSKRLGGGPGDSIEVRQSSFFTQANIDWLDVFERRIQPPYQPRLQTKQDTSYFESQFTNLPPEDSPTGKMIARSINPGSYRADDSAFIGFSYDPYAPMHQQTMEAMSPINQRQTVHGYPSAQQRGTGITPHQPVLSPLTKDDEIISTEPIVIKK